MDVKEARRASLSLRRQYEQWAVLDETRRICFIVQLLEAESLRVFCSKVIQKANSLDRNMLYRASQDLSRSSTSAHPSVSCPQMSCSPS
jgi:hypothetical protein